jgi:hypothetical protein
MQNQQPIKIYIIYAPEDADALQSLDLQLSPLCRIGLLKVWSNTNILPGQHSEDEIKMQLQSADIILLLISGHFLASDYIHQTELKDAYFRHESDNAIIIPIIVRPCLWKDDLIVKQFKVLPSDENPIFSPSWQDANEAMVNVVEGIKRVLKSIENEFKSEPLIKLPPDENFIYKIHDNSSKLKYKICSVCKGSGCVTHINRSFLSKNQQKIKCKACSGTGIENPPDCRTCLGSGKVNQEVKWAFSPMFIKSIDCPICYGSGKYFNIENKHGLFHVY